jgi:hypothetical protein
MPDQKLNINNDEKLMLNHFFSNPLLFDECGWSYKKSADDIYANFKSYILGTVPENTGKGKEYIISYLTDIRSFINSCLSVEEKIKNVQAYTEFYLFLEPFENRMYPFSIRLNKMGLLDDTIGMLEKIEFLLKYGTRQAKKDVFEVLEWLTEFDGGDEIPPEHKDMVLKMLYSKFYEIYKEQKKPPLEIVNDINMLPAAKYALYIYNKTISQDPISYDQYKNLEIEHIFAQSRSFPIERYGFTEKDYVQHINTIGNFTLLEKELNGSEGASNKSPEDKIKHDYLRSEIKMTQEINIKNMSDFINRTNDIGVFLTKYFSFDWKK